MDEAFQDFSEPVGAWARQRGFAFDEIRKEVGAFYDYLHGSLTNADLEGFAGVDRGKIAQLSLLRRFPAVLEWLRLKAALSVDLLDDWCQVITEADDQKELSANAFMTPFNLFTGFDYAGARAYCDAISPKLYTMHWSVMVEFWGRVLLERNPGLDEALVTRALAQLFDLGDQIEAGTLAEYGYPTPDQAHPIPDEPQARKISQVLDEVDGGALVAPLMHGYGRQDDFARRFAVVARSGADGVWINRYGYLSDEKLDAIGALWRGR